MVNVLVTTDTRYPVNRKIIRQAVVDVFKNNQLEDLKAEVSVSVVGTRKMKQLCEKYMNDGQDHEVLSFGLEDNLEKESGFVNPPDDTLRLGDVILCWPKVLIAAARDDKMVDDEVYMLISHSVEHLFGKHHE